ncbi:MAG: hypothetical protein WAU58_11885 [Terriglobales bacterium]
MSRALLKSFLSGVVLLAAITSCVVQSPAEDKPADKYNVRGSVLTVVSRHGHFYQVATDSRIYLLMCTKVKTFQFGEPECKTGDKPIAPGDTVHFRVDGDWAYMPIISEGAEEQLRIFTTELKVIPALPAPASAANASPANTSSGNATGSNQTSEPGLVIGTGLHVKGQSGVGWSTAPTSPMASLVASSISTASAATPVVATAPVTAIPVTGGPPVVVMPTGPTTGGVVTGVPVTGGAPITAVPTAPVMGVPASGAHPGGGATIMIGGGGKPQWVHVLRIQTAGKIYQLECSSKPCMVANKEIELGDTLVLRADKKHAYVSAGPQGSGAEQEYKVLSVTEAGSAPHSEQH